MTCGREKMGWLPFYTKYPVRGFTCEPRCSGDYLPGPAHHTASASLCYFTRDHLHSFALTSEVYTTINSHYVFD